MRPGRVLLVRHGNTFGPGDVITRVGARTDLPLVASGLAQAKALGAAFAAAGERIDRAFCSPLQRTKQTAELILAAAAPAALLQVSEALREVDHGPDENRPEPEVLARIGADALRLWEEEAVPPPDWRVDPTAAAAAWRALLEAGHEGETRLFVTSNGIARFALMGFGQPPLPKLRTGAYGVIQMEAGGPVLHGWDLRP